MANNRKIKVFADWEGLDGPKLMGVLHVLPVKGREVFSFEYAKSWLASDMLQQLDPDLQLYAGPQYLREERENFGLFTDSSPDRWGRLLMRRHEAALARQEKRALNTLRESDYLLGVYDGHRMGGLRFKIKGEQAFQNDNKELASPPWTSLRALENASMKLEDEEAASDPAYMKWLQMLVAPGSSLGGARPKAGVVDPKGQLWIAKFPSKLDEKNMGAWEMVAHEMAKASGINVAAAKAQKFLGRHHTFLAKRFDRSASGKRIHFASAMTMLGYNDVMSHEDGVSYLELAEFLMRFGESTNRDLEELWRRIVFSIAISNTDDHLRNHGFMLGKQGWYLSPAYDMNPVEYASGGLKLNISLDDNALDFELAMEVAPYFRVRTPRAKEILAQISDVVSRWAVIAKKYGIARSEQEMMTPAFRW